jgi:hypothetical protein
MSHEQFSQHAVYPGHYQDRGCTEGHTEAIASTIQACYAKRLQEQLGILKSELLPCQACEEEQRMLVTEMFQEALVEIVKACASISRDSGLSDAQAIAHLIEQRVGVRLSNELAPEIERTDLLH